MEANYVHKDSTTLVQDETGTYIEIPRNRITFKSKEAEIIFDLTLENDELRLKNQELKLELSGYRQAILNNKEMLGLKEQNDKLKKQLENYKKLGFKYLQDKNNDLETQQKEFIKYLEDEKDRLIKGTSHYYIDSFDRQHAVNETIYDEVDIILQKYKSIIGDDK